MDTDSELTILEQALRAFAAGRTDQAERLLVRHADRPECAGLLRDYLVTEGRIDKALEWVRQHPDTVGQALEAHLAGDYRRAAELCREALLSDADDSGARLHFARAVNNLGDSQRALDTLEHLVRTAPGFAPGWHALGHVRRARGELEAAIAAYQQALELSPGLRRTRFDLGLTCLNADRPERALACFDALLEADGPDPEVAMHAGLALHLLGRLSEARERLGQALKLAPDHPEAHRFMAGLLNEVGEADAARDHLVTALESRPEDPELLADLADIHELGSELESMADAVERGLAVDSRHPRLLVAAARLDRRNGQLRRALGRLARIDPQHIPPRLALRFFQERGLTLDRLGEADAAMRAFETANRISAGDPRARRIDGDLFFRQIRAMHRWLDSGRVERAESDRGQSDRGPDLCFLIGFPRSGTTLIETVLDAHRGVATIEERPTLEPLVDWLAESPTGYPGCLDTLDAADTDALRRAYRERVAELTDPGKPRLVVDKLPLRMLHVALIRRLFPDATLLWVERHPCDVVLSNFMQIYEPTPAFVHTTTLAGTVRLYDAVMSLWPRLAPLAGDRLLPIRYEALVADAESRLAAVFERLGLDWSADLLDPEHRLRQRERVRTTSYQQVTEPVYRRAVGRWQHYRRYLAPHFDTLATHVERMGYSLEAD
jgi:tetratricopeptide (TPR) repeat protein